MRQYNVAIILYSLFAVNTKATDFDQLNADGRSNITVMLASKTMIKLKWSPPADTERKPHFYRIHYNHKNVTSKHEEKIIKGLQPFTDYTIKIFDCYESCSLLIGPVSKRTKIGIPSAVNNFSMQQINTTTARLAWDPPRIRGGPTIFYSVHVRSQNRSSAFNTTDEVAYLRVPTCRPNETSVVSEVLVNANSVDNSNKTQNVTYTSTAKASVIFYLKCPSAPSDAGFRMKNVFASTDEIFLDWTCPNTSENISSYVVNYNDSSLRVDTTETVLRNLKPFTKYNVSIMACDIDCTKLTTFVTRTKYGKAEKVENVMAETYNKTHLKISWNPSEVKNGPNPFYIVRSSSKYEMNTTETDALVPIPLCGNNGNSERLTVNVTAMNTNDTDSSASWLQGDPVTVIFLVSCSVINNTVMEPTRKSQIEQIFIQPSFIYLQWTPSDNEINFYEVTSYNYYQKFQMTRTKDSKIRLVNLYPGFHYTVTVQECSANCSVLFGPLQLSTSAPDAAIENLTVVDLNSTHIRIAWQPFSYGNFSLSYRLQVDRLSFHILNTSADVITPSCENMSDYRINVTVLADDFIRLASASELVKCPSSAFKSISTSRPKISLTRVNVNSTNIYLEWENQRDHINITYKINYNEKTIRANDANITLQNLIPNTLYKIELAICDITCSNVSSTVQIRTNVAASSTVDDLQQIENRRTTFENAAPRIYIKKIIVSGSRIELEWNSTKTYAEYMVVYNSDSFFRINREHSIISNLQPNADYKIEILGCEENCVSLLAPFILRTNMDTKVQNVTTKTINDDYFRILWLPPTQLRDKEFSYFVRVNSSGFTFEEETEKSNIDLRAPVCETGNSTVQFEVTVGIIESGVMYEPATMVLLVHCRVRQPVTVSTPKTVLKEIYVSSTWVEFKWTGASAGNGSYYVVACNDVNRTSDSSKVMLKNLSTEADYKVQVYECEEKCRSIIGPFVIRTRKDVPVKVEDITVTNTNSTHIRVAWKRPPNVLLPRPRYSIRIGVEQTTRQFSTQNTHVDLEIPFCGESSNLIYKISISVLTKNDGNSFAEPSLATLMVKCTAPQFYNWSILCPYNKVVSVGILLLVAFAGFLPGLTISLLNMRKFSYNYKLERYK